MKLEACILALGLFCVHRAELRPMSRSKRQNFDPMEYLENFGYFGKPNWETGALRSADEAKNAIKQFQKMAAIPMTGTLDRTTIQKMQSPRCGISDGKPGNLQQSFFGPSKWDKKDLTYSIKNYSPDLYWQNARRALEEAFKVWSDVAPLTFREVPSNVDADINISFDRWYHSDGYAFDGKGGVLAHAFPPGDGRGGDAHFDEDELWTVGTPDGTNLFTMAAHEFGHSLGLYHSDVRGALMYPFYQGYNPNLKLDNDDVSAIQHLYGGRLRNRTVNTQPPTLPPRAPTQTPRIFITPRPTAPVSQEAARPDPCNTDVDALTTIRGEVFAFKGKWFWRMNRGVVQDIFPVEIRKFWDELPPEIDSIDAFYERLEDGRIIIFRRNRYWELDGTSLAPGTPKSGKPLTELGIPSIVTHLDAAFVWGHNRRTYLFSGYDYWRLDKSGLMVERGYPKTTDIWTGVPVPFDDVFTHRDGKTYFFKGKEYWAFNDTNMRVEDGYPKPVSDLWKPCVYQVLSTSTTPRSTRYWSGIQQCLTNIRSCLSILFQMPV